MVGGIGDVGRLAELGSGLLSYQIELQAGFIHYLGNLEGKSSFQVDKAHTLGTYIWSSNIRAIGLTHTYFSPVEYRTGIRAANPGSAEWPMVQMPYESWTD